MQNTKVAFWLKESGNSMSHGKGLLPEEIEFLQSLKVGDRLILWDNNPKDESKPKYSLRKYEKDKKASDAF